MGNREQGLDPLAELDALVDIGRRAAGSDAERRAAQHLRTRLEDLGRPAEIEPFAAYPNWPIAYLLLASVSIGASVLAVYVPAAGAALALVAALLLFLDASLLVPTVRRLLGRRASQNVVSWNDTGKPGTLVLVAHLDAGRAGIVHSDAVARRRAALRINGLQIVVWAQLAVLAATLLRLVGIDGTLLTAAQLVPTFVLIVAVALLADVALAGTKAGENDNASGTVLALRLATGAHAEHFDVHVLLTGAGTAGAAGLKAFVKRHDLPRDSTVFLNLDKVGSGEVRYVSAHPQLRALAEQVEDAARLATRSTGDAAAATDYAAITITCRDRLDYASGRVHEESLEAAEAFCLGLIDRLDEEVGPSLADPPEATALSEP
jgi:peptidase M28-like protein